MLLAFALMEGDIMVINDLPDFENFDYRITLLSPKARLRAWSKLRECERRLAIYKWAEKKNDINNPQCIVLLNDAVSAFLMTFETVFQFLLDECFTNSKKLNDWLEAQPEYDVLLKGFRTLRHFEAHVESKPAAGHITVVVGGPTIRRWSLQELTSTDLRRLRTPPLTDKDAGDWNSLVNRSCNVELFTLALEKLVKLVSRAESILP